MEASPSNLRYRESHDFLSNQSQALAVVFDCTSSRPLGFARQVIERYPYVDVIKKRPQKPGSIDLWGSTRRNQRYIVGMFAQLAASDTSDERLGWFQQALFQIGCRLPNLQSIAFSRRAPKSTNCPYEQAIVEWARSFPHLVVELVTFLPRAERFTSKKQGPMA